MYASQHGPRYSRVIEGLINHIDGLDIYKEVRFLSTSEEDEHDDRAYRFSTRAAVYSRRYSLIDTIFLIIISCCCFYYIKYQLAL